MTERAGGEPATVDAATVDVTTVVIVGAGVAGLTLANLLQRGGIGCVVLERQSRHHVERRQRAGVLEYRAVRLFQEWGLGETLLRDAPEDGFIEIRLDGQRRLFDHSAHADGRHGRVLPQQLLVRRLIAHFLDGGGDLRFEAGRVRPQDLTGDHPWVTYQDASGVGHRLDCDYVAGCDGEHGIGRASMPADGVTAYRHASDIGWFTVLADVPPPRHPLFAVSRHGFAAQFGRGPRASRFYLQCPPGDDLADWSDDRIWRQLRQRLGDPGLVGGAITEKVIVDERSIVLDPMSYGRLFLAGDAAHIVTPMGGKGMNLAVADAGALAGALRRAVCDGHHGSLRTYSETCLRRVWSYQEFSCWMTEMLFHAGDPATAGPFRQRLARARLERLFTSGSAARMFTDLMLGEA